MDKTRPGNLFAAWWNIIICGFAIVSAVSFGVTKSPFGFLVAAVGIALEVVFVRVLVEIHRERRSASGSAEDRYQYEDRANDDAEDRRNHDA
jgi:hypothetical protein